MAQQYQTAEQIDSLSFLIYTLLNRILKRSCKSIQNKKNSQRGLTKRTHKVIVNKLDHLIIISSYYILHNYYLLLMINLSQLQNQISFQTQNQQDLFFKQKDHSTDCSKEVHQICQEQDQVQSVYSTFNDLNNQNYEQIDLIQRDFDQSFNKIDQNAPQFILMDIPKTSKYLQEIFNVDANDFLLEDDGLESNEHQEATLNQSIQNQNSQMFQRLKAKIFVQKKKDQMFQTNKNMPTFYTKIFLNYYPQYKAFYDEHPEIWQKLPREYEDLNENFRSSKAFNIKHLNKLLNGQDEFSDSKYYSLMNRKVMKMILRKHSHNEVILNGQINQKRLKKTYLNMIKVFKLRCMSNELVKRMRSK